MQPQTPINTKSLKEQVYEYLRQQIHQRQLLPGSAINMESTSRQLGISKTPLRDALLQLEMDGFVTISPRRGVTVNTLSLPDIRNFYQVIGALESSALLAQFSALTPAITRRMRALNQDMARTLKNDDFELFYEKNLEFHNCYIALSRNAALIRIIDNLKKRLYDFIPQEKWLKEWEEFSIGEHQRLVVLIEKGEANLAADFIRTVHWSFTVQEKFIRRYYFAVEAPSAPAAGRKKKKS